MHLSWLWRTLRQHRGGFWAWIFAKFLFNKNFARFFDDSKFSISQSLWRQLCNIEIWLSFISKLHKQMDMSREKILYLMSFLIFQNKFGKFSITCWEKRNVHLTNICKCAISVSWKFNLRFRVPHNFCEIKEEFRKTFAFRNKYRAL